MPPMQGVQEFAQPAAMQQDVASEEASQEAEARHEVCHQGVVFKKGDECRACHRMTMRKGEGLDSAFIMEFFPPRKIKILEFGKGPNLRRAKVQVSQRVGWVSLWDSFHDPGIPLVVKLSTDGEALENQSSGDELEIVKIKPGRKRVKRERDMPEHAVSKAEVKPSSSEGDKAP